MKLTLTNVDDENIWEMHHAEEYDFQDPERVQTLARSLAEAIASEIEQN